MHFSRGGNYRRWKRALDGGKVLWAILLDVEKRVSRPIDTVLKRFKFRDTTRLE
ncbi:MAG: hypothetical protein AAGD22_14030 [Verrucomicrobiota bacterium]